VSSNQCGGSLGGLILIVLVLIWWGIKAPGNGETVSTYWLDADGRRVAEEVYSADRVSATVTLFMKDPIKGGIYFGPYKDCSIIDFKNWYCTGQGFESIDGSVTGSPFDSDRRVHRVSRLRYWFARGKQEKDSGR
jgi:hypothetical protein